MIMGTGHKDWGCWCVVYFNFIYICKLNKELQHWRLLIVTFLFLFYVLFELFLVTKMGKSCIILEEYSQCV
jgi:hypothetical protein